MKVYRLMSKEELDLYISGNVEFSGKTFPKKTLSNNHRYRSGEKYVHMFRNLKDIDLIQQSRNFDYLVTFDIPMITLMISSGRGLYSAIKNGKLIQKYAKEYAININRMKPEYFKDYKKVPKYKDRIEDLLKLFDAGVPVNSEKELQLNFKLKK